MGMAASQARHLALVARKSNCEYEGQQINQARTALANQSANLFNQMLGLNVPVPPSTQDFTKQQYSFTDGMNASTITNWQQLATPEEDYNYVVTHHYNANVYTGSQKKLSDPQIQYSKGLSVNNAEMAATLKTLTSARIEYDKIVTDYENIVKNYDDAIKAQQEAQTAYDNALSVRREAETARDKALNEYNEAKSASEEYIKEGSNYDNLKKTMVEAKNLLDKTIENSKKIESYRNTTSNTWKYSAGTINKEADGTYKAGTDIFVPYNQITAETNLGNITYEDINNSIQALIDIGALPVDFDKNNIYITTKDSTPALAFKEDLDKGIISTEDYTVPRYEINPNYDSSIIKQTETNKTNIAAYQTAYDTAAYNFSIAEAEYQGLLTVEQEKKTAYDTAEAVFKEADIAFVTAEMAKITADTNLATAEEKLAEAETKYGPTISAYESALATYEATQHPSYIGNCNLTLLENLTENQAAELKQVVATMNELGINPAINDCFDADGNYLGGVYEFKLNGKTYYTSYAELNESYTSGTGINQIDGQTKLNYYNADYIEKKIEKTEKALLETDGNGRFTSVRFEDDTITYNLKMETITDEAAYNDAMNQYNYENAVYDKTIQDINAKTSIIQQQDQQLELRLKQLDTEHNALVAEIEAVSKVVKDNVDSTFKTFSN